MSSALVLVLNRAWQPVAVASVERAFGLLVTGAAKALDEQYQTFDYDSWAELGADLSRDDVIRTVKYALRVPRIVVLQAYDRLPKKKVRLSRSNVYARDKFTCQYCQKHFQRSSLNLDHVVPRCAGGRTTWENVVTSCVPCNREKGGRTPEQAGMALKRRPSKPTWKDLYPSESIRYAEWAPFLDPVSAAYWNVDLLED